MISILSGFSSLPGTLARFFVVFPFKDWFIEEFIRSPGLRAG